ncbi:RND transporter [Brevundimonas sp. LM2]|uniref:efflux transporter outer membrane subunit n=1 Tax=Brevundimonas sp. LM2 TaxID=1938605 RepID=UPI0009838F7D|nr:TolC family protein [Brevundimonas sp. LM2]AQR61901.1 RND transporter [Brevundimonas sp. LM2]
MRHAGTLTGLILAATAPLYVACAVGPEAPQVKIPSAGTGPFVGAVNPAVAAVEARDDWWRLYDDPTLDGLIRQAFARNNELEAAVANLEAVRASLSETRVARLPATSVSGRLERGRGSAGTVSGLASGGVLPTVDTADLGIQAGYEIDLFSRIEATVRAARADARAAEAALATVQVTVAAETTRAYADICSANAQISVVDRTLDLQRDTVGTTRALLAEGVGTELDVAGARAALAQTEANLPTLRAARNAALFRLATLTGVTPGEASDAAAACVRPPRLSRPIPVGDGAALLARRPDVRQAEANLAAAAARVNVATSSLYPRISLGGSAGVAGSGLGELANSEGFRFSLGPLIDWSFPNVLAARAQIRAADSRSDAALATFDQTVLTALEETETALSNYAHELDRRATLNEARDQAARAASLSRQSFDAGVESFLVVLDAERTLAAADSALAQSDALVTTYQIALFRALAGGWQPEI